MRRAEAFNTQMHIKYTMEVYVIDSSFKLDYLQLPSYLWALSLRLDLDLLVLDLLLLKDSICCHCCSICSIICIVKDWFSLCPFNLIGSWGVVFFCSGPGPIPVCSHRIHHPLSQLCMACSRNPDPTESSIRKRFTPQGPAQPLCILGGILHL